MYLCTIIHRQSYWNLLFSLLGAMFPLPRVIYAMASDGLIFGWMGRISSRFHTPLMGTFSAGLLTGLYSSFFVLQQTVNRIHNYRGTSCDIRIDSARKHDEYRNVTSLFHRCDLRTDITVIRLTCLRYKTTGVYKNIYI